MDGNFQNGFVNSLLVQDCWRSYFQIKYKTHQICILHLLWKFVFFEDRYESQWAINFKELLYEAIELKRNLTPIQYLNPILQRDKIIERLSVLLLTSVPKNRKDLCTFHKRIDKYKEYVFTFLFHDQVPQTTLLLKE
ncbi:hypothetical protein E0H99_14665 [Flavobacterium sp. GT3P67]|nr:hypothetical protein E0H99_14665 [Flavobacterium sp. GT3P67]